MAGTLSVDGLISGLDTKNLIDQLVAVQTSRIDQLTAQQDDQNSLIALFQKLQGLYLGLRTSSDTLKGQSFYEKRSVSSSDTDILTVTASADAEIGSHQLTVTQLATKNQYASNRFSDTNLTTLGEGTLSVTVGTGSDAVTTDLTVDSTNNTLSGIASLINSSVSGVSASIIKVDNSETPYQLLVTAKGFGEGNAVSITQDSNIKVDVTGEILGDGAATVSQDTDDSDASTYALRHYPNTGTVTIKLDGTSIQSDLAAPSTGLGAASVLDGGGTLTVGREYAYVVSAVDASGETLQSTTVTHTLAGGNDAIDFSFDDVDGATSYRIYRIDDTEYAATGTAALDATDFQDQDSLIGTVTDDGSTSFTFRDTGQAQQANERALATATQGYTLDESTGAVAFRQDQTATVTADYDYDLEFKENQAAQDAIIELGSGSNAVTIRKSTNFITDVIEGVTLSLKKADNSAPVLVDVSGDTSGIQSAASSFITALNNVNKFLADQTYFDSTTFESGPLFSNSNVFNIRSRVSSIVTNPVAGIPLGQIRSLSEVGVSINPDTGNYSLDTSKFSQLLEEKPDEIRDLFAGVAKSTDSDIETLDFTADTKVSSATGYLVNITRAAQQAQITGSQDLSGGLAQDETLSVTVSGLTVNVALTAGTTGRNLASTINTALENGGITTVGASYNSASGKLSLIHDDYGSAATFQVVSSVSSATSGSTGLGSESASATRTATGVDVSGTINGELAVGSGQILAADENNANTAGLRIRVGISATQLAAQGPSQGSVVVTRGVASQLEDFLAFLTDETQEGPIQSAITEADNRIQDLQDQIDTYNQRAAQERAKLQQQFNQLEQALGSLQSTSTFLEGQLQQFAAASNAIIRRKSG